MNHRSAALGLPKILATADFRDQPALCGRQVSCGFRQSIPSAKASGDTHKSDDDVATSEEVEVVDPRHPLYGRRYRLISIGKETTTRGACKELFARVHYRFGLTLLLPLGVTNLERNDLPRAASTKLSLDALQDL